MLLWSHELNVIICLIYVMQNIPNLVSIKSPSICASNYKYRLHSCLHVTECKPKWILIILYLKCEVLVPHALKICRSVNFVHSHIFWRSENKVSKFPPFMCIFPQIHFLSTHTWPYPYSSPTTHTINGWEGELWTMHARYSHNFLDTGTFLL